ncbi:MAG TPA: hypothetical protein VFP37_04805 [Steroidobacteraceae bacterium]|nr:hypothetical protein [Steroidobacteraceae bacterium]
MRLHKSTIALSGLVLAGAAWSTQMTDAQVRQQIVRESVASYSGRCPCPENTDSAGRRCGARSAYSKPGGARPICYTREVSDEQIREFRKRHSN